MSRRFTVPSGNFLVESHLTHDRHRDESRDPETRLMAKIFEHECIEDWFPTFVAMTNGEMRASLHRFAKENARSRCGHYSCYVLAAKFITNTNLIQLQLESPQF
jgi:hypothetical protein